MIIKKYHKNVMLKNKKLHIERECDSMSIAVERYCTISESLEESLKQMKLMREGKMPKRSWNDYRKEKALKRDKEE